MKRTFRISMTWLHTWSGLILGWVCYAIFVTGTASYYRPEITRWMRPELTRSPEALQATRAAVGVLEERAADAKRWLVDLPDSRSSELRVFWQPAGGRRFQSEALDAVSGGPVEARASYGGEFFYRFHFQLLMPHPWGRYTAGVAAMAMFVALITGVIAHRRFFADMFLFRPGRAAWRSWLDFHNAAGVLTLPFFLMIVFSGLVIFDALYLPWPRRVLPADKPVAPASATTAAAGTNAAGAAIETWIQPASLAPMIEEAVRHWGTERFIKRIDATDRGTESATVVFTRVEGDTVSIRSRDQLTFDGVTGQLRHADRADVRDGPAQGLHGVLYGLHMARFAGPVLRGLLFALGVLGTGLIASGLVMWTVKRRTRLAAAGAGGRFGLWFVERLNIAAMAGLPLAIAGLFWANRLLPVASDDRANLEVRVFLITWGAALLHACLRPVMQAWREQLVAGGLLFVALPLLDAIAAREFLLAAGRSWDFAYLGFECVSIAVGTFLVLAAGKVARRINPLSEEREGAAPLAAGEARS